MTAGVGPASLAGILTCSKLGDLLGFVGLIFLALPALSMANAGFRARSFGKMELGAKVDERLRAEKNEVHRKLLARAQEWSSLHTFCLYLGYAFFFASYVVTLFISCVA